MKIIIQTNADFTPKGKRTARQPYGRTEIRWYVSGRIYHRLPGTAANLTLTQQWMEG